MIERDVCPKCDCELSGDCCGGGEPFPLDGVDYCCEDCAVDGACQCGCAARADEPSAEGEGSAPGPLLA